MSPGGLIQDRMHGLVGTIARAFSSDDSWVKAAFLKVPRHRFIRRRGTASPDGFIPVNRHQPGAEDLDLIYSDQVVMIHHPPSSASQPYVVAKMLEWLEVKPGMKVLEIGTGSGFNAALLAEGTGDPRLVFTIDIQDDLVAEAREHLAEAGYGGVNVRAGDGGYGWPEAEPLSEARPALRPGACGPDAGPRAEVLRGPSARPEGAHASAGRQAAPFDRIIVTAGSADIPSAWLDQLAEGGELVMPLATPPVGDLQLRLRKKHGVIAGEYLDVFYFMSLQGAFHAAPSAPAGRDTFREQLVRDAIAAAPGYACAMSWAHRASFWVFARGQAQWFSRMKELWHRQGAKWIPVMSDPGAGLYVTYDDRGRLNAYGHPGPVWNFGALVERWKALGWPTIQDFAVTVERDPAAQPGPGAWLDQRPSVTLRTRLKI